LIDQVSVRHKLKRENEALQKLFRQNWEGPLPAEWTESSWHPQTLERHQPPQISIRLANWSQISKELGSIAEIEFDQMIQRLLSSNIRGGDRVMRRHQNEYLLLFSDLDKNQLKKCKQRLQQSLKELRLEANEKSIPIKVQVSQPDPARSAS
jgi:GGDEF domain-containing protein